MPEDLKVSQIGSSPLPPPFRGLHSPRVKKHCQIIFACYFWKLFIEDVLYNNYSLIICTPEDVCVCVYVMNYVDNEL